MEASIVCKQLPSVHTPLNVHGSPTTGINPSPQGAGEPLTIKANHGWGDSPQITFHERMKGIQWPTVKFTRSIADGTAL